MFVNCSKDSGMLHAPDHDNKLTNSQSKSLIEKEVVAQPLKKFPSFYETRRTITVSQAPTTFPYSVPK
jgi:hypothetical protein